MKDLDDLGSNPDINENEYDANAAFSSETSDYEETKPTAEVPEPSEFVDGEGIFHPHQKPVNFVETRSLSNEKLEGRQILISLLRESGKTLENLLDARENFFRLLKTDQIAETPEALVWQQTLWDAISHTIMEDTPRLATERQSANWVQELTFGKGTIRGGKPKQNPTHQRSSRAEIHSFLTKESGLGASHEAFLPHSGIWIRIRVPTLQEVTSMQSNLKYRTPSDLEDQISTLDEPFLHLALAAAMFSDGFNYNHPCIADVEVCTSVLEASLQMLDLAWYDSNEFTENQLKHLAAKFTPCGPREIEEYKAAFVRGKSRLVWFGKVGIKLEVPVITIRRRAGDSWIRSIIEMTQGAFNEQPHETNRSDLINRLAKASEARQFAQWVTGIFHRPDERTEPTLVTTDEQSISDYLNDILSDDDYSEKFYSEVNRFIDDSLIGMVAITSFNCPVCSTPQAKQFHERMQHLIPLDMLTTFFTLAAQRVKMRK